MNYELIQLLIQTVGVAAVVFIIGVIVHYIKRYNLERWVTKAVNAAEIMFDIPGSGEEKKEWVLNFLKENTNTNVISEESLNCLIEAAVNSMNNAFGTLEAVEEFVEEEDTEEA